LEQRGDLDTAEDVLIRYARHKDEDSPAWPNAVQLLYAFYERHPQPGGNDHKRREALERLCALVPSHPLTLTLYRIWRDEESNHQDCVGLLFGLLDYTAWRDIIRPWRLLARNLAMAESTATHVMAAWSVRRDWWPAYHFTPASLPHSSSTPSDDTLSLIGYKACVSHYLLSPNNTYTQMALALADRTVVKTKGMSLLKKVVQKASTSHLGS